MSLLHRVLLDHGMECRIFFRTEFSHQLMHLERFVNDTNIPPLPTIVHPIPDWTDRVDVPAFALLDRSVGGSNRSRSVWVDLTNFHPTPIGLTELKSLQTTLSATSFVSDRCGVDLSHDPTTDLRELQRIISVNDSRLAFLEVRIPAYFSKFLCGLVAARITLYSLSG